MEASTVTLSPKFQIVIPRELRERLKLKPGQKLIVYEVGGKIYLTPPRPLKELRGMCPGLDWTDEDRDHSERF